MHKPPQRMDMVETDEVESVIEEFSKEFNDPKFNFIEAGIDEPWETDIITDWLREKLTTITKEHIEHEQDMYEELEAVHAEQLKAEYARGFNDGANQQYKIINEVL